MNTTAKNSYNTSDDKIKQEQNLRIALLLYGCSEGTTKRGLGYFYCKHVGLYRKASILLSLQGIVTVVRPCGNQDYRSFQPMC